MDEPMEREKREKQNQRVPLEQVVPLSTPYIVYIDPSGACNFKCNFCPCYMSDYRAEERHTVMSMELFEKILRDLKEMDEQIKVVYLWGFGEPLVNRNLPDMVKRLREEQVCRDIRIYTNGSLLSPEVGHALVDYGVNLIRVSLEGINAETYSELCGYNMDYEELVGNLAELYRYSRGKMQLGIKIVNASLKTREDVSRFYDTFEPISDFLYIENIENVWPDCPEIVVDNSQNMYSEQWNTVFGRKKNKVCAEPLISMMIHSNGIVSACCADWKFATAYGDVREKSIKEIWNSEELKQFQLAHLERGRQALPFCEDCIIESDDDIDCVAGEIAGRIRRKRL